MTRTICSKDRLLDYVYDELPPSERTALELHLHECRECRTELAGLGDTRLALASWAPPDAELGFRVVRDAASAPRRSVWAPRPAWGLAAAAVLVLAAAAAIANLEVRYDSAGFVVRTGWTRGVRPAPADSSVQAAVPANSSSEQWKADLQLLDTRLRQLEQSSARTVRAATLPEEGGARMSDAELLGAVRKIIAASEARQQRELALRVTQVIRDFDTTRATDLARVEQGLRQIQGLTDAELIRHRDTLNHLLRVTQRR